MGVCVRLAVADGVFVGRLVGVAVAVGEGMCVGVAVAVGVNVGGLLVAVGVFVAVAVGPPRNVRVQLKRALPVYST